LPLALGLLPFGLLLLGLHSLGGHAGRFLLQQRLARLLAAGLFLAGLLLLPGPNLDAAGWQVPVLDVAGLLLLLLLGGWDASRRFRAGGDGNGMTPAAS